MKKFVTVLLLFVFSEASYCQQVVSFYLNARMEITTKEMSSCKCEADFDLDNLQLNGKLECYNLDGSERILAQYKNGSKEGSVKLFTVKGKPIFDGTYQKNLRRGIWTYFYPNGSKRQVIKFTGGLDNMQFMVGEYYDEQGQQLVRNGNGRWRNDSIPTMVRGINIIESVEGDVLDSLKHGKWNGTKRGKRFVIEAEEFDHGQFLSGWALTFGGTRGKMVFESMDKLPDQYSHIFFKIESLVLDSTVYNIDVRKSEPEKWIKEVFGIEHKIINRKAGYRYGERQLLKFIAEHIRYPSAARMYGHQGTVIIQLTIATNGSAKDFKVLRSPHDSLAIEALRIITEVQGWLPAISDGQAVEGIISIPVRFVL
jgi:TonB family protein